MKKKQLIDFLDFVDTVTYILEDERRMKRDSYPPFEQDDVITNEQLADLFIALNS